MTNRNQRGLNRPTVSGIGPGSSSGIIVKYHLTTYAAQRILCPPLPRTKETEMNMPSEVSAVDAHAAPAYATTAGIEVFDLSGMLDAAAAAASTNGRSAILVPRESVGWVLEYLERWALCDLGSLGPAASATRCESGLSVAAPGDHRFIAIREDGSEWCVEIYAVYFHKI